MKLAKKAAIGVVALVGMLMLYAAVKPAEYSFSREIVINATPEKIFPHVNNSKKANDWMPWKDSDPGVVMHYSGPEEGVGATTSWDSKGQMGTGRAEVVESVPGKVVRTALSYQRPMEMTQVAEVLLTPAANGTTVRWSVNGKNGFIGRLFCMFMNMDKRMGKEFERGLSNLKAAAER